MLRLLEVGLVAAVCVAVLGFGGTVPSFFAVTQLIVLELGILSLLFNQFSQVSSSVQFPIASPVLLIALVLLQVCPLPLSLAPLLGRAPSGLPGASHFTLSMAPYQTASHLLLLVAYLTAFFLTLVLCRGRRAKKRLVYALVSLGVFEALYGLVQYLAGWQHIWTYVKKYYLDDATGTYINRNHFAGFLEMILPFAVALTLLSAELLFKNNSGERTSLRRLFSSSELPRLMFWFFVVILLFSAVVLSRSRMGIISAVVSLVAIVALAGTASTRTRTRVAVATLFFLSVLGVVVWIGNDPVMSRFETLGQEYNFNGQNRISIWRDTIGLTRQHPFVGTGFGSFTVVYPSVQTAFLNLLVDHAHCDYLEVATELGLPGAVLLFGSVFWVLVHAVRHYAKPGDRFVRAVSLGCIGSIVAILLHSLADFNLYIPANALVFAVILAVAQSNTYTTIDDKIPRE
ncbi:MAG TPA: O-antigen ligase family protein [Candidatus Acidoferrum sp.]|nr:O-antigen ligase family protein [Candidatus Acidoferrum sp.]